MIRPGPASRTRRRRPRLDDASSRWATSTRKLLLHRASYTKRTSPAAISPPSIRRPTQTRPASPKTSHPHHAPVRTFRYRFDRKSRASPPLCQNRFDDAAWKTTDVAVETWSTLGHHDDFKSIWYRATVDVPPRAPVGKTYLWIGATDGSVKSSSTANTSPTPTPGQIRDQAEGYCEPSLRRNQVPETRPKEHDRLLCTRTAFNELGTGGLIAPVVLYTDAK